MPSPGDLIEIFRESFHVSFYQHWAVYVGDGFVVHLVNLGSNPSNPSKRRGKIKKQKLDDVVEKDKWQVNNELDNKYKPRPAREIVDTALSKVGEDIEYKLTEWNCEHFAKWLRYGRSESAQVLKYTIIGTAAVGGAAVGATIVIYRCSRCGQYHQRQERPGTQQLEHENPLAAAGTCTIQ